MEEELLGANEKRYGTLKQNMFFSSVPPKLRGPAHGVGRFRSTCDDRLGNRVKKKFLKLSKW